MNRFYRAMINQLGFLLLCIAILPLQAQISQPQRIYQGVGQIHDLLVLDYDHNGLEDIFTIRLLPAGTSTPPLPNAGLYLHAAYEIDGRTAYMTESIIPWAVGRMWALDYDADGDQDILAEGDIEGTTLRYALAENREGRFITRTDVHDFFIGESSHSVSLFGIYDFNVDGKSDYLYRHEDSIKIAASQGDGTFDFFVIPHNTLSSEFLVADVNNDDLPDLFLENAISDHLTMYLSTNVLEYSATVIDSQFVTSKKIQAYSDITGDGSPELIISQFRSGHDDPIFIAQHLATGQAVQYDTLLQHPYAFELIDISADGFLDLYSRDSVFINNGQGAFLYEAFDLPVGLYDINQQAIDISAGTSTFHLLHSNLYTRLQIGDGDISLYQPTLRSIELSTLDDVERADINGDGYDELFVASRFGHVVFYLEGLADKGFGKAHILRHPIDGAHDIEFADFDGDGYIDVCYSGFWGGNLRLAYGNGHGEFEGDTLLIGDAGFMSGMQVADFENDGFPDIVFTNHGQNVGLRIFRNREGTLQPFEYISTKATTELVAKDLDHDGDIDIYTTTHLPLLNDGTGNFTEETFFYPFDHRLIEVDFDGDGIEEIVTSNERTLLIYAFDGDEYSVWQSFESVGNVWPLGIGVIDYNGDGFLDIILNDLQNMDHRLYRNNNNESFAYDNLFSEHFGYAMPRFGLTGITPRMLDVDGDGDLDCLYSDEASLFVIGDLSGDASITGKVFWDENEDGRYDDSESGIQGMKVHLSESDEVIASAFTDANGRFRIYADPGTYTVSPDALNDCWHIPEAIEVEYENSIDPNICMPIALEGDAIRILSSQSHAPTRCGFSVRYHVALINDGCTPVYGRLKYMVDDKIASIAALSIPYTVVENTIDIPSIDLLPGESFTFNYVVEVPGVDFIGQYLQDSIAFEYDDMDGTTLDRLHAQRFGRSEIRCAYDPNDKLAFPDRSHLYDKPYVVDEAIQYTIRFQNTGNDTAFRVTLLDTLDGHLDLDTFRPLSASHDYSMTLHERDRILEVRFDNILLPDSTTNEVASHGFFTFLIKPLGGLDDFTVIENTAGIYFDFNPPIQTNKVAVEFVSDLSLVTSTTSVEPTHPILFPNPTIGMVYLDIGVPAQSIEVFDARGAVQFRTGEAEAIDLSELEAGMYFIVVKTPDATYSAKVALMQ